jgi:hypothetical protein
MRLIVLFMLAAAFTHAQTYYTPFYEFYRESKPQWVQLMYAPNPNFQEVVAAYQDYYSNHAFEKNGSACAAACAGRWKHCDANGRGSRFE